MNVWKLCITYSRSFRILAVVLISISSTQVHDVDYEHAECTVNRERTSRLPACVYVLSVTTQVKEATERIVKGRN